MKSHQNSDVSLGGDLPLALVGASVPQLLTDDELERIGGGTYTGQLPIIITCDASGCRSEGDCD